MTPVRDHYANANVATIRSAAGLRKQRRAVRPELLTPKESRHSLVVERRIVAVHPMRCLRYHHLGFTLEAAFEFRRDEEEHRRASLSRHQERRELQLPQILTVEGALKRTSRSSSPLATLVPVFPPTPFVRIVGNCRNRRFHRRHLGIVAVLPDFRSQTPFRDGSMTRRSQTAGYTDWNRVVAAILLASLAGRQVLSRHSFGALVYEAAEKPLIMAMSIRRTLVTPVFRRWRKASARSCDVGELVVADTSPSSCGSQQQLGQTIQIERRARDQVLTGATLLALGARAEPHFKTNFVGHGQCVVEGDRLDSETAHQQPRRGVAA
jgi:hypothetical protein